MYNLEPICQELNPLKTTISACSMLFIVIKMTFSENWVNSRHLLMSYWYLYYFHSIFFQLLSEVNSFIFYSSIAQRSFEMQVTSKNCYWNKRLILLLLQCTMDGKNCRRSLKMQRWVCLLARLVSKVEIITNGWGWVQIGFHTITSFTYVIRINTYLEPVMNLWYDSHPPIHRYCLLKKLNFLTRF